jgi:hypothetical protein
LKPYGQTYHIQINNIPHVNQIKKKKKKKNEGFWNITLYHKGMILGMEGK